MSVKIITLDLDGTLMSPDHITVSERNRRALSIASKRGVKLAISTGRTLAILGDVCDQVPEIDYIMYSNGAAVFDRRKNKNIYTNFLSEEKAFEIIRFANEFPVFYEVYIDGCSYSQRGKAEFFDMGYLPKKFLDDITAKITECDDIYEVIKGKEIEKVNFYCLSDELIEKFTEHFSADKELYLTSSMPRGLEVTTATACKGTALEGMCRALGISLSESMAFGDAENDCSMLEISKYSFAMENAMEKCKQSASHITKSNGEDGVAVAVEKYVLCE